MTLRSCVLLYHEDGAVIVGSLETACQTSQPALPEHECPELFAVDGTPIDPEEFSFFNDPVTGELGQSKTLLPGWRVQWVETKRCVVYKRRRGAMSAVAPAG
mmetsp:Transcript_69504/g.112786  ORF Transcript_69504/g.112786 Transcript_69504/m.112786 type:complete len:102 (-) Transcript_69504:40-345(-)